MVGRMRAQGQLRLHWYDARATESLSHRISYSVDRQTESWPEPGFRALRPIPSGWLAIWKLARNGIVEVSPLNPVYTNGQHPRQAAALSLWTGGLQPSTTET